MAGPGCNEVGGNRGTPTRLMNPLWLSQRVSRLRILLFRVVGIRIFNELDPRR